MKNMVFRFAGDLLYYDLYEVHVKMVRINMFNEDVAGLTWS